MSTEGGTEARSSSIAADLRRQILQGKWEAGDRLPSERDLAARLGVHRSSVREALKKLEQLGMIAIRRGGGARVLPLEDAGLGLLPHLMTDQTPQRELIAQWFDVWELVLAGAARLAIERATEEELDEAVRLLRRLRGRNLTAEAFIQTSDRLTGLVARASRNLVLRMVRNDLTAQLDQRSDFRLRHVPPRKVVAPLMKAVEDAVESRDPVAVEEAVRRLIRQNRQQILDLVGDGSAN